MPTTTTGHELVERSGRQNVGRLLLEHAAAMPKECAVLCCAASDGGNGPARASYAWLADRARRIALLTRAAGLEPGARALVFVRPGADLLAITFGLFLAGHVPVFLDPGLGRRALLAAVERSAPRAMFGVARAHLARLLCPRAFRSLLLAIPTGTRVPGLGPTLEDRCTTIPAGAAARVEPAAVTADDPAAILFTSGSTGPPKGVVHTHGTLAAQVAALRTTLGIAVGERDVAALPAFALFAPALGTTVVFPEIDPRAPARCDPARVVHAIQAHGATNVFASPTIWRRVVPYCRAKELRLLSLRRVLVAGAPVPRDLVAELRTVLADDARVFTPYGATEALPVAIADDREILAGDDAPGRGTCIGRPVPGVDVRLVRVVDGPIADEREFVDVAPGELGEVCARGPVVSPAYADLPAANRSAKVAGEGGVWHRMGDLARRDAHDRLWFAGRVAHRVVLPGGTLPSVPSEQYFSGHPAIARVAVVGSGSGDPSARALLVAEPLPGHFPRGRRARSRLAAALLAHGRARGAPPEIDEVLFKRAFPMDARHQAKIRREQLAEWAAPRARRR